MKTKVKQNKNNVSFICNYNSPQGLCFYSTALAGKGLLCPKQHIIMNAVNAVHKKKSITKKQGAYALLVMFCLLNYFNCL